MGPTLLEGLKLETLRSRHNLSFTWGRPGLDVGREAAQCIPRPSYLVNTAGKRIVANDERYALAA